MATNPCGLSFEETVEIIKNNVLGGTYNGRTDVMRALLNAGFSYPEATEVTNWYYKIYRRIAKNRKPVVAATLSPTERREKVMASMAVDYLSGDTGGMPMSEPDLKHLESIYKKSADAATPSLKERFDEEANAFIAQFMPTYTNQLFSSSVYARPLLSTVFFVKSLLSNFFNGVERSLTDTIWDGKKMDFKFLGKFDGLGNKAFVNVLKGGVPATNLYQSEQTSGGSARLEEFPMGEQAKKSNVQQLYYGAMRLFTKWSNRLNSAPDTRGIFRSAERHFYQLMKERYRNLGKSDQEATQQALTDMDLDDRDAAIQAVEANFAKLGLPSTGKNGKRTSEFNVAVAEYRRRKRDNVIWEKAIQLSKNDFWKRNMTQQSELGFGDYGIFGLKVRLLSALRNKIAGENKSKLSAAFNMYAFGFLNGAANFAEDAIERMPLYGTVKLIALQARKKNVTDKMLIDDISRRQKDIIVKNVTTALFFLLAKEVEEKFCPSQKDKVSSGDIAGGFVPIGVCGIPAAIPPQMLPMYKVYQIINNDSKDDGEYFDTVLSILPILVQSNNMGLSGSIDRVVENVSKYKEAKRRGDSVKMTELIGANTKGITRMASDYVNNFLPLPSRLMNEAGTFTQRSQGGQQRQQELPFSVNDMGTPNGVFRTLGKMLISNLGNVTGVSELWIAAMGSNKPYAVDWQGRTTAQFRGSDIIGNGITYNQFDEVLIEAGVHPPYIPRTQKVKVDANAVVEEFLDEKVKSETKEVRYMTDEEYHNVSIALGKFNKDFFTFYYDGLVREIKEDKRLTQKSLRSLFEKTKGAAVEAIEIGKSHPDEIYQHVVDVWEGKDKKKKTRKVTETIYDEE